MSPPLFFPRIEGLRGLAALSVAIFHALPLIGGDRINAILGLRIWMIEDTTTGVFRLLTVVFNGNAAVSLFFVVSGFVLALALERERPQLVVTAAVFVVHRTARIMPALAVNLSFIMLAWTALVFLMPSVFQSTPGVEDYLANLLLLRFPLNGVSWTLQIEFTAIPIIIAAHFARLRLGAWLLPGATALAMIAIFFPFR